MARFLECKRIKTVLRLGAGLLVVVFTAVITHYLDIASRPKWETIFADNKDELARYASDYRSGELHKLDNGNLPVWKRLSNAGVMHIAEREGFLFFSIRPEWLDDSTEVIVFDLKDERRWGTSTMRCIH